MRRTLIALTCVISLFIARPVQAGWRDYVSPSRNWQRIKNCCSSCTSSVKHYCQGKVDKARADQEKNWGLKVPADLNAHRPLAVMIHGLDSNNGVWFEMAKLLEAQHWQVAYFSYPSDGPIQDGADRLAKEMAALHAKFPTLRVSLIGHSMGSLVARAYIEGDAYAGQVDHFIAIAPPNHGSPWTRERFLLEAHEQYWAWRSYKDWSPLWMFTDGHGEAADDLKPDSKFLKTLNARPRRAGVKYTIIAGDHNILSRFGANGVASVEWCLPDKNIWGIRQARGGLQKAQAKLRDQTSDSDGVVPIASTQLDGVTDFVRLHADHNTLAMSHKGAPPAAWEAVRERLTAR
jgi:pimeloyl-ACP methyl ester carboxylesterase